MKIQFKKEMKSASKIRNKGYYFVILKLSCRIFNLIERLRVDFPLLNRPFIYGKGNYQTILIKDMLKIRHRLTDINYDFHTELNRILDKSGMIVKVSHISELN